MRRAAMILVGGVLGLGVVAPADAAASGGPVPPVQGRPGVTVAGSPFRFIAVRAGPNTKVERVRRANGSVDASVLVHGQLGVPGAAYDGTNTGLSTDGRTLVLAGFWNGISAPKRTELAVVDAVRLRLRYRILLPGFSTVDAISPAGRWLYLIHYKSPNNSLDYQVRAYDLAHRQLLTKPVVDPREPDEKMVGTPMKRIVSPGGRWVYTLYIGDKAFVHALDTQTQTAFCIDLPPIDPSTARLALGPGPTLRVTIGGLAVASIDTRTMTVRSPAGPVRRLPAARHPTRADRGTGSSSWALAIVPLAAVAGAGLIVLALRRRRRRSPVAGGAIADAP